MNQPRAIARAQPARKMPATAAIGVAAGLACAAAAVGAGAVNDVRAFVAGKLGLPLDEFVIFIAAALIGYLLHALVQHRRLVREVVTRSREEESARSLALCDPLTGLLNRRGMDDLVGKLPNTPACALLLCDLDGFKAVNDTHGHRIGDEVLKEFAGRLSELSIADVVIRPIRLGGDEFVLFLSSATEVDTVAVGRELLRATSVPIEVEGLTILLSASVGIVRCEANDTLEDLLSLADDAMYEARRKGVPMRLARANGQGDDELGLRRLFEKQIAGAATADATLYSAAIGVDRFRELRRTLGHGFASCLFRELTRRLAALDADFVFERLSFDVLGVVFAASDQAAATARMDDVRASLELPLTLAEGSVDLQLTIGLAGPGRPGDIRILAEQSQSALDEAWREGVSLGIFDEGEQATVLENIVMMADMRVAVRDNALDVHYQPKLRTSDGAIDGVEALVRWHHPTLGDISPARFVPVAERTGNIRAMTQWVLDRVIRDQAALAAVGHDQTVYVNVSAELIGDNVFAEALLRRLRGCNGGIGIEITETAVLSNPERALANLTRLAESGIKIAIDDYGVGLSSLAYLKQLPASELKLDMLFITNLATSHRDPMIVRSTIELAHGLGLRVTAEGVSSDEAVALLRIMGCDMLQGYRIARPMSLGDLTTYLDTHDPSAFAWGGFETPSGLRSFLALAA